MRCAIEGGGKESGGHEGKWGLNFLVREKVEGGASDRMEKIFDILSMRLPWLSPTLVGNPAYCSTGACPHTGKVKICLYD